MSSDEDSSNIEPEHYDTPKPVQDTDIGEYVNMYSILDKHFEPKQKEPPDINPVEEMTLGVNLDDNSKSNVNLNKKIVVTVPSPLETINELTANMKRLKTSETDKLSKEKKSELSKKGNEAEKHLKQGLTSHDSTARNNVFSPSDKVDSLSDISIASTIAGKHELDNHLTASLNFYGTLNADLGLQDINKDCIGAIRLYIRKISRMLNQPRIIPILNNADADRAFQYMKQMDKITREMNNPPDMIFNELNNHALKTKVLELFEDDLNKLDEYAKHRLTEYHANLAAFEHAKTRVERAHNLHHTRQTVEIMDGNKNIPPHYFLDTPPVRNHKKIVPDQRESVSTYEPDFQIQCNNDQDPFLTNIEEENYLIMRSDTPNLPWSNPDIYNENESLSEAFGITTPKQSLTLTEYMESIRMIPRGFDWDINSAVKYLNSKLEGTAIHLSIHDPELEQKILYLEQNKHYFQTQIGDEPENTVPTERQADLLMLGNDNDSDDSQYLTPSDLIDSNRLEYLNKTKYYTPMIDINDLGHNNTPKREAQTHRKVVLQYPDIKKMDNPDTMNNYETTLEDLMRFQRDATEPSTKPKTVAHNKLQNQPGKTIWPNRTDLDHKDVRSTPPFEIGNFTSITVPTHLTKKVDLDRNCQNQSNAQKSADFNANNTPQQPIKNKPSTHFIQDANKNTPSQYANIMRRTRMRYDTPMDNAHEKSNDLKEMDNTPVDNKSAANNVHFQQDSYMPHTKTHLGNHRKNFYNLNPFFSSHRKTDHKNTPYQRVYSEQPGHDHRKAKQQTIHENIMNQGARGTPPNNHGMGHEYNDVFNTNVRNKTMAANLPRGSPYFSTQMNNDMHAPNKNINWSWKLIKSQSTR